MFRVGARLLVVGLQVPEVGVNKEKGKRIFKAITIIQYTQIVLIRSYPTIFYFG